MHSFKEIVARLVIVASVVIIVETRARYIYQPGPFVDCEKLEIPCGGRSEASCNDYCEENGFFRGSCNGHCCLCYARPSGMLPFMQMMFQRQHSVLRGPKISTIRVNPSVMSLNTPMATAIPTPTPKSLSLQHTSKPKRFVPTEENEIIPKPTNNQPNNGVLVGSNVNEIATIKEDGDVCLTPDCVKTANKIIANMDENVNPCDDFYKFTCGNFMKDEPIPEDKGSVTLMGSINDKLTQQLREILEENKDVGTLSYSARLAKTLYDSCSNSDLLENSGISPLYNLLKAVGGWPVLEGHRWDATQWTWENTIENFRKTGLATDYLLKVSVINDFKVPSRRIINIAEPILGISKEQLHNPVFMDAYRKYQINVAVLLGAERAAAEQEMSNVLEFERTLANISLPRELTRAHPLNFYHPMPISKLQTLFPKVQWLSYVRSLLPNDVEIDENQIVNVHVPEQLTVLLNLFDKTDSRVLANYLMWRASSAVLPYLNEEAIRIQQYFTGAFTGKRQRKPRWRECVDAVTSTLGQAIGALYVRRHFDETSKKVAIEMVNDIRKAFFDILAKMDWMDTDTKLRAFEKLTKIKTNIGFPKELLDERNLEKLYAGLELNQGSFFGNLLNLTKGATDFGMRKLIQPVDKNDWLQFSKPAMVNAFYQPFSNSIQFPAGILQGHFFDKNRPSFMNYGSIGWVIGHEITHGFDDAGSHFDSNGEIQDWWNPVTKQHFHDKAKCLVDQYGSFSYKDLVRNVTIPINGRISVGENIADNGGIKQAYKGYLAWVERNGSEKKLPGLKYTPNQLFWVSAASNWCSKVRPQQMVESILMGVHSPGEYRVRGTFANLEQFSKDFNCPAGSNMNPVNKCSVW